MVNQLVSFKITLATIYQNKSIGREYWIYDQEVVGRNPPVWLLDIFRYHLEKPITNSLDLALPINCIFAINE